MNLVSIEDLQSQFSIWRRNKKSRGERIPEDLWNQAVLLCRTSSINHVSKMLKVSYSELKARSMLKLGVSSAYTEESCSGFIQVGPPAIQSNSSISIKSASHEISIQCSGPDFDLVINRLMSSFLRL